jgi:hypothetical protein
MKIINACGGLPLTIKVLGFFCVILNNWKCGNVHRTNWKVGKLSLGAMKMKSFWLNWRFLMGTLINNLKTCFWILFVLKVVWK